LQGWLGLARAILQAPQRVRAPIHRESRAHGCETLRQIDGRKKSSGRSRPAAAWRGRVGAIPYSNAESGSSSGATARCGVSLGGKIGRGLVLGSVAAWRGRASAINASKPGRRSLAHLMFYLMFY